MKLIIAGNHSQYEMWKRDNPDEHGIEVRNDRMIRGIHFCGKDVIRYGTYYCRKDLDDIKVHLIARARCCHEKLEDL